MFSLLPLVKNTAVVVGCVVVGVAAATADIIKKYCCCVWCYYCNCWCDANIVMLLLVMSFLVMLIDVAAVVIAAVVVSDVN